MLKIISNIEKEWFVKDIITELQSNGYRQEQLAEISHCILNKIYDSKEDSRWELKRKMMQLIYQDLI